MPRRLAILFIVALCLLPGASAAARDTATPRIRLVLEGRSISPRQAGRLHCHDFDHPTIRCFGTRAKLERNVRRVLTGLQVAERSEASYVRIFEHELYGGSSAYLSEDYYNLGSIGWNDRITSFRVVNGGSGTFYAHAGYDGQRYHFDYGDRVSNIGDAWNDRISSVTGGA